MICNKCGKDIMEGMAFCGYCGAPAEANSSTATTADSPTPTADGFEPAPAVNNPAPAPDTRQDTSQFSQQGGASYCGKCGRLNDAEATFCIHCGANISNGSDSNYAQHGAPVGNDSGNHAPHGTPAYNNVGNNYAPPQMPSMSAIGQDMMFIWTWPVRDKRIALLMAFLLGWAGAHKFYLRKPVIGVIRILVFIFFVFFMLAATVNSAYDVDLHRYMNVGPYIAISILVPLAITWFIGAIEGIILLSRSNANIQEIYHVRLGETELSKKIFKN